MANGAIPPPPGYLQSIREVCDRHGILLILDEVIAGFGRTGKWFACENWDVVPDIMTVAKGINSGYVPLGAMVISEPIAEWVRDKYFAGGLTYSGHPLACAAGVASIEAFREEGIVENAAEMGEVLGDGLAALADKHESIGEVRGLGMFYGVELVKDRETREPLVPFNASGEAFAPMAKIARAALDRGLYLFTHWNVIIVGPPLTITREEIDEGLSILDEALAARRKPTQSRHASVQGLSPPGTVPVRGAGREMAPLRAQSRDRPRRDCPCKEGVSPMFVLGLGRKRHAGSREEVGYVHRAWDSSPDHPDRPARGLRLLGRNRCQVLPAAGPDT